MFIVTCFGCTLYYFYTFSGTNLLTRCQSASSVFPAVFGFRNPTRKILSKSGKSFPPNIKDREASGIRRSPGGSPRTPGGSTCSDHVLVPAEGTGVFLGVRYSEAGENILRVDISETKNSRKHGTGTLASC